ncbi:hypothetical protein HHI36_014368 [Cryptolaemus montrouzieri]|uniref:Uncharacterized protein n=1 Tax=Cryptolaemus montrouzieri TaxID=559131 RepID=A0ABD2N2N6_9CUCU
MKIHGLKVMDRSLHSKRLYLNEYIHLMGNENVGRSYHSKLLQNKAKLDELNSDQIDDDDATNAKFMDTHTVKLKIPKFTEKAEPKVIRVGMEHCCEL